MPYETAAMKDVFTIRPKCKMTWTSQPASSLCQSVNQSFGHSDNSAIQSVNQETCQMEILGQVEILAIDFSRPNWNANADTKLLLKYFPNCLDSCDCYGYSILEKNKNIKRNEIVMISSTASSSPLCISFIALSRL